MKQRISILAIILYSVLISIPAFADGDPAKGKSIYATCAACHGQNGEGLQATNGPRLAGQRDWYLVGQLEKFGSGLRGANPGDIFGAQMAAMAKALLNEEALMDVVAYIGTLQASQPQRTETSGDPIQGKKDFHAFRCARCHGLKGQGFRGSGSGSTAPRYDSPRLAGQHDWYLIRQLQNFKADIRGSLKDPAGLEMRADAKALRKDQTILDVVAYISTLDE